MADVWFKQELYDKSNPDYKSDQVFAAQSPE